MSSSATFADGQTCRSAGTPSMGLDEPRAATFLRGKADVSHLTDLVGAGPLLMLIF
jgi:hypothetical protein